MTKLLVVTGTSKENFVIQDSRTQGPHTPLSNIHLQSLVQPLEQSGSGHLSVSTLELEGLVREGRLLSTKTVRRATRRGGSTSFTLGDTCERQGQISA